MFSMATPKFEENRKGCEIHNCVWVQDVSKWLLKLSNTTQLPLVSTLVHFSHKHLLISKVK